LLGYGWKAPEYSEVPGTGNIDLGTKMKQKKKKKFNEIERESEYYIREYFYS
jgi:hypothetical protein